MVLGAWFCYSSPMPSPFVHLHLHSEYSMVDGTVRIKPLIEKARELGMPAIAVTDQHNLFALVKFYRAAEAAGIKPIVGADVLIRSPEEPDSTSRLVLLCQDRAGYLNLCALLSRGYLEGQHHGVPYVRPDWVTQAFRRPDRTLGRPRRRCRPGHPCRTPQPGTQTGRRLGQNFSRPLLYRVATDRAGTGTAI